MIFSWQKKTLMTIWNFIAKQLNDHTPCVLLYVLQSKGSSPGRQGFSMSVAADGQLYGSIGGGIMEHKMVEKAKDMLKKKELSPFFKPQIHHKQTAINQSGMICSGEQMIVLYPLYSKEKNIIQSISNCISEKRSGILQLFPTHIYFSEKSNKNGSPKQFRQKTATDWQSNTNLENHVKCDVVTLSQEYPEFILDTSKDFEKTPQDRGQ